jgi:AcrR family transcriptional regulator
VIIDAARQLFLHRGYSHTSISSIAREAGVSPETVYADFGCKRAVLASVVELALAGRDGPDALLDWPELTTVRAEPDPARKVELLAGLHRAIYERSAAVLDIVRAVADSEPEVAELLRLNQQQRLAGQANMMRHLADADALRSGLAVEEATDIYWIVGSSEVYQLLVRDRRWDPVQYESWLSRTLCRVLLTPGACGRTTEAAAESAAK